jgi:hypothetical protein
MLKIVPIVTGSPAGWNERYYRGIRQVTCPAQPAGDAGQCQPARAQRNLWAINLGGRLASPILRLRP